MTDAEPIQQQAGSAAAWVASEEGQQALAESTARAQETAKRFEPRRLDWQELHQPVTI